MFLNFCHVLKNLTLYFENANLRLGMILCIDFFWIIFFLDCFTASQFAMTCTVFQPHCVIAKAKPEAIQNKTMHKIKPREVYLGLGVNLASITLFGIWTARRGSSTVKESGTVSTRSLAFK